MENVFISEYTRTEEIMNSVTHGLGALLSIAGLVILVVFASIYGNAWHIVSYSVFGASMFFLYLASTLYHSFGNPRLKYFLKKMDHSAIFIFIAGSYTPFTLVHIKGVTGWTLFGVIWGLAVSGIILKFTCISKVQKVSSAIYLLMGWLCILAGGKMIASLSTGCLVFLVCGGLAYSLGVIFYTWKSLKFNHAIWHLFVMAGSSLHFFAVFKGFFDTI